MAFGSGHGLAGSTLDGGPGWPADASTSREGAAALLLAGGPTDAASTTGIAPRTERNEDSLFLPWPSARVWAQLLRLRLGQEIWFLRPRPEAAAGFLADLGQMAVFCL